MSNLWICILYHPLTLDWSALGKPREKTIHKLTFLADDMSADNSHGDREEKVSSENDVIGLVVRESPKHVWSIIIYFLYVCVYP